MGHKVRRKGGIKHNHKRNETYGERQARRSEDIDGLSVEKGNHW